MRYIGKMTIRTLGATVVSFFSISACSFGTDNGLLAMVPADSQFIVGIDVTSSRNSELGQFLSTRFDNNAKGLDQLTAETGFDPKRDLASIVYAGVSSRAGRQDAPVIVLARGVFDQNKIRSAALAKGAVVQSFLGVDLYLRGTKSQKNGFAFIENDVFATGSVTELQKVVANRSTRTPIGPELNQLISNVGTGNDIWFASTIPASRLPMPLHPDTDGPVDESRMLQTISAASGGVQLGSLVKITIDAVAQSEKDASSLVDVVRFGASLLRSRGQSDSNSALLSSALSQMLVSSNGQNVHLSLSMPESALEQLAESAPQRRHFAH